MTRARVGRCVVVLLLLMQTGCALVRRSDGVEFEAAPIMVAVDNRNWSQVTVYVVAGGQRQRLGELVGTTAGEFELPGLYTTRTDVRLIATPLASRQQYVTGVIIVSPGATIHLIVANVLSMSSYTVR